MNPELILSASSVNTFLRCGYQWYLAYVVRLRRPPSVRQAIGIASHTALEVDMAQKIESHVDLPVDEVLDAFSTDWDSMEPEIEDDEDHGKIKDSGVRMLRLTHADVLPQIQPIWVERDVQFEVNGIPYSGTVDVVDDRGRVRDWKTARATPGRGSSHLLQMTGYALGYRQETGQTESEVVLDYLVYKKLPEHLPIASGGPISDAAVSRFAEVVHEVDRQIGEGRFLPNGLSNGACSWCGYAKSGDCPYFKEYRQ